MKNLFQKGLKLGFTELFNLIYIENIKNNVKESENLEELIELKNEINIDFLPKYEGFLGKLKKQKEFFIDQIDHSNLSSKNKNSNKQKIYNFCDIQGVRRLDFLHLLERLEIVIGIKKDLIKNKEIIEKQTEAVKEMEHTVLSHVLTLLGIFTTIITIIITTISITANWLNNSNNISFVVAILMPASIILLSVFLLLVLISCFFGGNKCLEKENGQTKQKNKLTNTLLITSFAIIMIMFITSISLAVANDRKPKHNYIVISNYEIQENNEIIYIYNGVKFTIACNYNLIHEDELHYCIEHNCFE